MQAIDEVLHKEMTRKEFIATLGFGLASLFGFSTIFRLLSGKHHTAVHIGYGSSVYGGIKNKS